MEAGQKERATLFVGGGAAGERIVLLGEPVSNAGQAARNAPPPRPPDQRSAPRPWPLHRLSSDDRSGKGSAGRRRTKIFVFWLGLETVMGDADSRGPSRGDFFFFPRRGPMHFASDFIPARAQGLTVRNSAIRQRPLIEGRCKPTASGWPGLSSSVREAA